MTHTQRAHGPLLLRTLVATAAALALSMLTGAGASAGGWAVGSLDAAPSGTAGSTEEIGFTILQHGQTPVDIDDNVGIDIYGPGGMHEYFPARGDGAVGHYVATVTFPEAGTYTWEIRMGVFDPQPLGTLSLALATGPVAPAPSPADPTLWTSLRWVLFGATAALLLIAVGDLVVTRRRGATAADPVQPVQPA